MAAGYAHDRVDRVKKVKKWFDGLKLNAKFTLISLSFVLIPMVVLGGWLFWSMEKSVVQGRMDAMEFRLKEAALLATFPEIYDGRSLSAAEAAEYLDVIFPADLEDDREQCSCTVKKHNRQS